MQMVLAVSLGLFSIGCKKHHSPTSSPLPPTVVGQPSVVKPLAVSWTWQRAQTGARLEGAISYTYRFTAEATDGAPPYTFRWNFGDGTPAVTGNPVTHEFDKPGIFTVVVTVTDSKGGTARSTEKGADIEIGAAELSLSCFADPTQGKSPLMVQFRAKATNNVGRATYVWDFGDGEATSADRLATHTYEVRSGTTRRFDATASVMDSGRQTVSCSKTIVVTGGSSAHTASATTGPATAVGTTVATLNGTVNANGSSTTVIFEYGTTVSYGTTVTADQSPVTGTTNTLVSKGISGLTPGTTYHFRVAATSSSGTTYGTDMTFTTP